MQIKNGALFVSWIIPWGALYAGAIRKRKVVSSMMRRLSQLFCSSLVLASLSVPVGARSAQAEAITLAPEVLASPFGSSPLVMPELALDSASAHGTTLFGLPVNEGPIDRTLRAVVAAGLIGTGIYGLTTGSINTPVSATLLGVAAIPALTAATGYCPLYSLFGVEYTF